MSATGMKALRRAKDLIGTELGLADVVGVTQPSVNYMLNRGKKVPSEWCLPLEAATGGKVTRHQLRPDLYPAPRQAARS